VRIRFDFEYQGVQGSEAEYPGTFVRVVDVPIDRTPIMGEAIRFDGNFVARVTWILWSLDGQPPRVDIEVHPGYSTTGITRAGLRAAGWNES
jgi:hypothetical protein